MDSSVFDTLTVPRSYVDNYPTSSNISFSQRTLILIHPAQVKRAAVLKWTIYAL